MGFFKTLLKSPGFYIWLVIMGNLTYCTVRDCSYRDKDKEQEYLERLFDKYKEYGF